VLSEILPWWAKLKLHMRLIILHYITSFTGKLLSLAKNGKKTLQLVSGMNVFCSAEGQEKPGKRGRKRKVMSKL